MQKFDVVVIGAGAAGLFCAGVAGQGGLKVLVLDHGEKIAEKIRISGGGRCNFANREAAPGNFISENPNFCRSALARYTPRHFIDLVQRHGIAFHEKHKGQLFCDRSAEDIINMLLAECAAGSVSRWQPCGVAQVRVATVDGADGYEVDSSQGVVACRAVVVASGGLSIPKIGATDFGYRIAQQFGLRLVQTRPALVPLTFDGAHWAPYADLAGLSLPVQIETGAQSSPHAPPPRGSLPPEGAPFALGRPGGKKKERMAFLEDLLFTHRGLSGPAVLQISSYWRENTPIRMNLAPDQDVLQFLSDAKARSRKLVANELAALVPTRLADAWVRQDKAWQRPVNEAADKALAALADKFSRWEITPVGTEGYKKAEVTAGGVDTRDLSSQSLESKQPGLYFIGEVVDVTGWLGGYNFQWAWASAHACGVALAQALRAQ